MQEINIQINNKNISKDLIGLIERWCDEEADHLETEQMILDKAKEENIDNLTLRHMLETVWRKRGLSDRTMFRRLPDQLKNPVKQEAGKKGGSKSADKVAVNDSKNVLVSESKPIEMEKIPPPKAQIKEAESEPVVTTTIPRQIIIGTINLRLFRTEIQLAIQNKQWNMKMLFDEQMNVINIV